MTILVQAVLLACAAAAFAAAGACTAMGHWKQMHEGGRDPGLVAMVLLLSIFASLCAGAAGGAAAILAIALPVGLAGYTTAARRSGLFTVQTGELETHFTEGSELHT